MPSSPKAWWILEQVEAAIAAISAGDTYRTTVRSTALHRSSYTQLDKSLLPHVAIVPADDTSIPDPNRHMRTTMRLHVECVLRAPTELAKLRMMFDLRKDIIQAIQTDSTLGAYVDLTTDRNATMCTYVGAQFEGHPDLEQGSMRMLWDVTYNETHGDA